MIKTCFYVGEKQLSSTSYSADVSTFAQIAKLPLLADPYEQLCCFVQDSTLGPNAGQGLFARTDLPSDTVVSFYNGMKQKGSKVIWQDVVDLKMT